MKEIEIHTFNKLHEIIESYDARTVIYSGMKSVKYPLIPKIGRIVPPKSIGSREANEKEILRLFKERALRFLDFLPSTDWDWLFTIHPKPYEQFESEDMGKIIIPNQIRSMLKQTLNRYGVDRFALFPNLDGLSAHIEWLQSKRD
jgi:hypothetical protein